MDKLKPCPICNSKVKVFGGPEEWKPTYNDLLDGWEKRSMKTQTNCSGTAIETVYLNPACTREMNLFG